MSNVIFGETIPLIDEKANTPGLGKAIIDVSITTTWIHKIVLDQG